MSEKPTFGVDLDIDACERLAFTRIKKEYLKVERSLYSYKWFDYRQLHPVQATYLYAAEFTKSFRAAYRRSFDAALGSVIRALPADVFKANPITVTGIWRGRQFADAHGMPYNVYLDLAFDLVMRRWQQAHMPRPTQLYANPILVEKIAQSWEERQAGTLVHASNSYYENDQYRGLSHQDAHHEWLFKQMEKRTNPAPLLAELVFAKKLLPFEKMRDKLGHEMTARVEQYA